MQNPWLRHLRLRLALASLLSLGLFAAAAGAGPRLPPHRQQRKQGLQHAPQGGRLRHSVWAGLPIDPLYLSHVKGDYLKDPVQKAKIGKNIIDAKGIIDDISLVSTITIHDDKGGVDWHPMLIPGFASKRAQYLRDILTIAHENGIEVLAGYEITDTGNAKGRRGQSFVKLMATGTDAQLKAHAEQIVKFLFDDNQLDFDGVSFDLEINGLNAKHAANVTRLYHHLAQLLKKRGGKLVAYATGLGVDRGNTVKENTLGSFMAQPFSIGKGEDNILVRPMAYDVALKENALFAWHKAITEYAIDKVGLDPAQFQLGVKDIGNSAGNVTDPKLVAKRAREFLRPKGAGLVIFATGERTAWAKYKIYDEGLNPASAPPPPIVRTVSVSCNKNISSGYTFFWSFNAAKDFGEYKLSCDNGYADVPMRTAPGEFARGDDPVPGQYRQDGWYYHGSSNDSLAQSVSACRTVFTGLDAATGKANRVHGQSPLVNCIEGTSEQPRR